MRLRCSPIRDANGQIAGCIQTFGDNSTRLSMLDQLEKLEDVTLLDPLSNVGNRRFIEQRMEKIFGGGVGDSAALLFIDIDHFKEINDRWGHDAGDEVLRVVAATMRENLRPFDDIGRWGGEEFIIVAPNLRFDGLAALANRLRDLISGSETAAIPADHTITVSIGATCGIAGEPWQDAVSRADQLMYQSKREGRDRVTVG